MGVVLLKNVGTAFVAGGTSVQVVLPKVVHTGACIVVGISIFTAAGAASVTSVTDGTNTYGAAVTGDPYSISNAVRAALWYTFNVAGSITTITVNVGTASDITIVAQELYGTTVTDPLDGTNKVNGSSTTPSVVVTTVAAKTMMVGVYNHDGTDRSLTPGAGYTTARENEGGTSNMPIMMEDQAFTTAGAKTVDGVIGTGAVGWSIVGAAFKAAPRMIFGA